MKIPLTGNQQIDEATIRAAVKAAEAHAEAGQTVFHAHAHVLSDSAKDGS